MWLQHVQRMDTNRLPKQALQYKPKDRRTQDDQGRDGGTNFILRIKEEETRLTIQEHDDDDDDGVQQQPDQGEHAATSTQSTTCITGMLPQTR